MNEMRTKAIHIINELPEPYIVYALEILRNVRQMSGLGTSAKKNGFPTHLHERENSKEIEAAVDALTGALPDTGMTLDNLRAERLKKYADIA